jgi:hypothetical protein
MSSTDLFPRIAISRFEPMLGKKGDYVPGVSPQQDDLYTELFRFKDGAYAPSIESLRTIKDKKERDKFKAGNLPAFTFSAVVKERRSTDNIVNHTGVLVIDIDDVGITPFLKERRMALGAYSITDFRDEICRLDDQGKTHILYGGLSASGAGLFLMFLIDPSKHLECFESLAWEFDKLYGIKIDEACKDVIRLRFCTYDPFSVIRTPEEVIRYEPSDDYNAWRELQERRKGEIREGKAAFKSHAEGAAKVVDIAVYMIDNAREGQRHTQTRNAARLLGGYVASGVIELEYARLALRTAVDSKAGWDDPTTDAYRAIDWGLEKGQQSPIEFHVINPDDPNFTMFAKADQERQGEIKELYSAIHALNREGVPMNKIPLHTFCGQYAVDPDRLEAIIKKIYRDNQDEHNVDKAPSIIKHEVYMNKRWEFVKNEITQDYHCRLRGSGNKWTRTSPEDVYLMVSKTGFKASFVEIQRLLSSTTFVKHFNPIHEYFKSNEKNYDGSTDYIAKLAHYFKIEDSSMIYFSEMLKKMLVRTVKCAMDDHYVNRYLFVLASEKQNTGKSWFLRWLSPWGMDQYYAETPMEEHKDSRIRMCEVLIYNLEELSTLTKMDVNRLKAIISQGNMKERRPYSRTSETMNRICSFWGSTNRTHFLTDDQNTRWLIFNVSEIDWAYRSDINVHNIWAQAMFLYKSGYNCELNASEAAMRDNRNLDYNEESYEDTLLNLYFKPQLEGQPGTIRMTATAIASKLQELSGNNKLNITAIAMGKLLRKHAYAFGKTSKIRYVFVKPINQNPLTCQDVTLFMDNSELYTDQMPLHQPTNDIDVPF